MPHVNPVPAPQRRSKKIMRDAISLALNRTEVVGGEHVKRVYLVGEKLVRLAISGDMAAIREINERIDGKVAQAIVGSDDHPPIMVASMRDRAKALAALLSRASVIEGECLDVTREALSEPVATARDLFDDD